MLWPYKWVICFTKSNSAKFFPPAVYPWGQSLSGPEHKVQHVPPRQDRELQERNTFGCPHVFTPLCLCKPSCSHAVLTSTCLFTPRQPCQEKEALQSLSSGGAALDMTTLLLSSAASPGYLWYPLVNYLSLFLQNFTDTGQERERSLWGQKVVKPTHLVS